MKTWDTGQQRGWQIMRTRPASLVNRYTPVYDVADPYGRTITEFRAFVDRRVATITAQIERDNARYRADVEAGK